MPLPKAFDALYARCFLAEYGPFATDYVAFDLETTGVDARCDRPLQVGWVTVKDRKATFSADLLVNWPAVLKGYQLADFRARLEATRERMTQKGKAFPWTEDLLRQRGKHPEEVAARLAGVFRPEGAVAAHYGTNLDFPMFGRFMAEYGQQFAPSLDQLYDTCLIVKGCMAGLAPAVDEPILSYYKRLDQLPQRGPRCGLEACVDHFDLKESGAVKSATHLGAYDSWLVHLLLERLRDICGDVPERPRG